MKSIQWLAKFLGALDPQNFEDTVMARHEYLRVAEGDLPKTGLFDRLINAPALLPDLFPNGVCVAGKPNPVLVEGIRLAMAADADRAADAFNTLSIVDGDFWTTYYFYTAKDREKRWRRLDSSGAKVFDVLIRKHHLDASTGLLKAISRALEIEASEHKGTARIEKFRTLARQANQVWKPDTKQAVLMRDLSRLSECNTRTIQRHFAKMRKLPEFKSCPWLNPNKSIGWKKITHPEHAEVIPAKTHR